MAFAQVQFFSNVLLKQVALNAILPDAGSGPFATYYLLHGLSDDYTIWQRRTRIEIYAAAWPMIVVMPDGHRGFYTDNAEGPAYAQFFTQELPAFVERIFPARPSRSARCIGGLSMGGYGALRLALGRPDLFISANSHSGSMRAGNKQYSRATEPERVRIFGSNPSGSDHDLEALAKRAKAAGLLPRLRLDCGGEDFLLEDNRAFHAALEAMAAPHEYTEYPGAHDWDYWDLHVREALAFHAAAMGLERMPV